MTTKKDFKSIVRDRQHKTGESYTAALAHVKREQARPLGIPEETNPTTAAPLQVEAAVLKVGHNSTARIRLLGEQAQITLRSSDVWRVAPGQIITVRLEKRWTFRGDAYASGKIEAATLDVARLGLDPLPLSGGELEDLRERYENVRAPDPYAPIWLANTAMPRACFEMDGITWCAFPDNQGARFCLFDVRKGLSWEDMRDREEREEALRLKAVQRVRARQQRSDDRHAN